MLQDLPSTSLFAFSHSLSLSLPSPCPASVALVCALARLWRLPYGVFEPVFWGAFLEASLSGRFFSEHLVGFRMTLALVVESVDGMVCGCEQCGFGDWNWGGGCTLLQLLQVVWWFTLPSLSSCPFLLSSFALLSLCFVSAFRSGILRR